MPLNFSGGLQAGSPGHVGQHDICVPQRIVCRQSNMPIPHYQFDTMFTRDKDNGSTSVPCVFALLNLSNLCSPS